MFSRINFFTQQENTGAKAARAITNRWADTVGAKPLSCSRSNPLGLSSSGNVTERALDLTVEIGSQSKHLFDSTLTSAAG